MKLGSSPPRPASFSFLLLFSLLIFSPPFLPLLAAGPLSPPTPETEPRADPVAEEKLPEIGAEIRKHELVKILKESGKALSQVALPYNSSKEELKIEWTPGPIVLSRGHEPAIPPSFDVDPYVFFSTMESWKTLTDWYVPLFESNVKNASPLVQAKAAQLTLGIEGNREEMLKALFKYVSQEVEYVGIALGESAWKPYPPDYVLSHRYGDCKGKSALLIAMLRSAGLDAYGVLIKPADQGKVMLDIPSLDFTHMIAAVPKQEGGYLFMDPTLPMTPHDFLTPVEENRQVIVLDQVEPHFETTPDLPIGQSNQSRSTGTVIIGEDGSAQTEEVIHYTGLRAMDHRLMIRNTNPAILRDLFERVIRERYPQSQLENYEFTHLDDAEEPFILRVKAKIIGLAQTASSLLMIDQLPVLNPNLVSLVTFDQRLYPVFLGMGEVTVWEGTFGAPEGYTPKSVPSDLSLAEPFGSYERRYEREGNQLKGKIKLVLDQPVIPVETYPAFKAFIEKVNAAEKEKIIFEKMAALP